MNEKPIEPQPLSEAIRELTRRYFKDSGDEIIDLHRLILEQIEPVVIELIIARYQYNQRKAARLLGIGRTKLRELLRKYFDEKYVGKRGQKE